MGRVDRTPRAGRRRGVRQTLLLVVGLAALSAGALELALQHRYPTLLAQEYRDLRNLLIDPYRYQLDLRFGRWHIPGRSGTWKGGAYTINRRGLRGADVPYHKPAGRRRVLVMGDSVALGEYVNDDQTFCHLLQHGLPETDVLNMGVGGYGTGDDYLLLKEEGLKYGPDLILLVMCIRNDVQQTYFADSGNSLPANFLYLQDGQLKLKRFRLSFARWLWTRLKERSYATNLLLKRVLPKVQARLEAAPLQASGEAPNPFAVMNQRTLAWVERVRDREGFDQLTYLSLEGVPADAPAYATGRLLAPTPENYYEVELTKRILLEMARLVHARGAEFLLVLSPFKTQLDPRDADYDFYRRNPLTAELMRFCEAEGIRALDLLPVLAARGVGAEEFFLDGVHYTVWGHAQVAAILRQTVVDGLERRMTTAK